MRTTKWGLCVFDTTREGVEARELELYQRLHNHGITLIRSTYVYDEGTLTWLCHVFYFVPMHLEVPAFV
jgi:hypothetical protein